MITSREQVEIKQHLDVAFRRAGVYLERLPPNQSLGPEAGALFNTKVLRQIYGVEPEENVMSLEALNEPLGVSAETWLCKDNNHRLVGFISFGPFEYNVVWEKRRTPPNEALADIKLLGAKKGFGRLLMAHAMAESSAKGFKGAVLEVLGSAKNHTAIDMYKQFGFEHAKVFDPDMPGRNQIRNRFGNIVYIMTYLPSLKGPDAPLWTLEKTQELVDHRKLDALFKKKAMCELRGIPTSDDVLTYVETDEKGKRRQQKKLSTPQVSPPRKSGNAPRPMRLDVDEEVMGELERSSSDTQEMLDELLAAGFILPEEYHARIRLLHDSSPQ